MGNYFIEGTSAGAYPDVPGTVESYSRTGNTVNDYLNSMANKQALVDVSDIPASGLVGALRGLNGLGRGISSGLGSIPVNPTVVESVPDIGRMGSLGEAFGVAPPVREKVIVDGVLQNAVNKKAVANAPYRRTADDYANDIMYEVDRWEAVGKKPYTSPKTNEQKFINAEVQKRLDNVTDEGAALTAAETEDLFAGFAARSGVK